MSEDVVSLRERQAEAARSLIRSAALEGFIEDGYVATTMSGIAERAGVARQTVYNLFDSKAALLIAAIGERVEGAEHRSQRDDHRAIRDANSALEMIDLFAKSMTGIAERALPVLRIAYAASAIDGEVAKHIQLNEERRYRDQSFFIDALDQRGFLREDIPAEDLKRGFWLLTSPHNLITAHRAGWDTNAYVTWLTQTVRGLLLPPSLWST